MDNFDSKNNEPSIDEDRTVWRLKVNENIENLRARDYLLIRINKRIKKKNIIAQRPLRAIINR